MAADTLLVDALGDLAQRLCRSTVQVRHGRQGGGSGVIWSQDGIIITNAHVARGAEATVELTGEREVHAEVLARDDRRDLAALRVDATDLPAAPIGDSDTLRVGQLVLGVGNPLGMVGALTTGIIHAIGKDRGGGSATWVQADVRLAPGNSGGPLADAHGRVVGINAMVSGGLGLAVPSNAVQRFLRRSTNRQPIGVTLQPVTITPDGRQGPGMLVLDVTPGSVAHLAGLIVGDVLVGVDGKRFEHPRVIMETLQSLGDTPTARLDVLRGGKHTTAELHFDIARAEAA